MMLLLDSHVLVWLAAGHPQLGARAVRAIDKALMGDGVAVSSFSYWEIETLVLKKRIRGLSSAEALRSQAVALGLMELEVDGAIAIAAARLRAFHGDPADRILVATAQSRSATLVTADQSLLEWRSGLRTLDATH
jgi:PIN domain nuclease of toxin-antitoxin system